MGVGENKILSFLTGIDDGIGMRARVSLRISLVELGAGTTAYCHVFYEYAELRFDANAIVASENVRSCPKHSAVMSPDCSASHSGDDGRHRSDR